MRIVDKPHGGCRFNVCGGEEAFPYDLSCWWDVYITKIYVVGSQRKCNVWRGWGGGSPMQVKFTVELFHNRLIAS